MSDKNETITLKREFLGLPITSPYYILDHKGDVQKLDIGPQISKYGSKDYELFKKWGEFFEAERRKTNRQGVVEV